MYCRNTRRDKLFKNVWNAFVLLCSLLVMAVCLTVGLAVCLAVGLEILYPIPVSQVSQPHLAILASFLAMVVSTGLLVWSAQLVKGSFRRALDHVGS